MKNTLIFNVFFVTEFKLELHLEFIVEFDYGLDKETNMC